MRTLVALAVLLLACTDSWAESADAPKRTMPHQKECLVPLPTDFWDDLTSKRSHIRESEKWAWNERICLGFWADMRFAPGGSGEGEECDPAKIEEMEDSVLEHRELRPKFLELVLSHEPWASVGRSPVVAIKCSLVRGDILLSYHEIAPAFLFYTSKIEGSVNLFETKFRLSLQLTGSMVTGKFNAARMEVGRSLYLSNGTFADIDLRGAEISGEAVFDGAAVTGKLNAGRMEVGHSLYFRDGTFADIDLVSAGILGQTALDGATVNGKLNAHSMEVGRSLSLSNGTFADIDLRGAQIAGAADFVGATVTGLLDSDRMQIGHSLYFRDGTFADIDLLGIGIVGNVEFDRATVTGKLNADNMEVGGSLYFRDGTFADIDLLGVGIVGNVEFNRATVTRKLVADGMQVGRSLYLRHGTFADIGLITTRFGGNVQLAGSAFAGKLDLSGAAIGGELQLSSRRQEKSPLWMDGAGLFLRNVKAEALQARADDWSISGGDGFVPTDLTGFTYARLEGLGTSGGKGMGDQSADWLIDWIEAQRDHGTSYAPQPYTQLAGLLEAAGATDKAKAIRYAKFEHKQDHDAAMSQFRRAFLLMEQIFVGFGVYPFWALVWFAGLVVLGGLIAQWSNDQSVRRWSGLWYSLENALPLIETNERFKKVLHGRPWLVHFFHFQKAFGFFLATILVGALTLLSG